jgi:hypothetical protein
MSPSNNSIYCINDKEYIDFELNNGPFLKISGIKFLF